MNNYFSLLVLLCFVYVHHDSVCGTHYMNINIKRVLKPMMSLGLTLRKCLTLGLYLAAGVGGGGGGGGGGLSLLDKKMPRCY